VRVNVTDLAASVRFYSTLFGAPPGVARSDYAKWRLDDPRVNFAISNTGRNPGIDHLGLRADSGAELDEIGVRLAAADAIALSETGTPRCYANSDKHRAEDPQGVRWESFHTHGEATTYYAADANCGEGSSGAPASRAIGARPVASCCAPDPNCR
jgi:hypothetical protein